jgi:hypothetical protein
MSLIADGNIIAVKTTRLNALQTRNNTNWGEFATSYRIQYAPKFSSSLLMFDFYFGVQTTTHHVLQSWRLRDLSANVYLDNDGDYQSRNWVHAQSRGSYNGDNVNMMHVQAFYSPGTTSNKVYGLYHRNASGATTYVGWSTANNNTAVCWRHSMHITVYEIEA